MNIRILKLFIFLLPALVLAGGNNDFENNRSGNSYITFNPEKSSESGVILKNLIPAGFQKLVTTHPKFIHFKFKTFSKNRKSPANVSQLEKSTDKLECRLMLTHGICFQEYILSGTCMTRAP